MPVNFPNYLNAQILKPDTKGYEDFFSNILKGYQGGVKHKLETQQGREKLSHEQMKNALLKKYGEPREQAEIDYLKNRALTEAFGPDEARANILLKGAQADAYGEGIGSRGGLTSGQRALASLPAGARENLFSQTRPLGFSDIDTAVKVGQGWTLDDFQNAARERGIDVDNVEPIFAPTTANITAQKNQTGGVAEIDFLEQQMSPAMAKYSQTFLGFSPKQILDSAKGENDDDLAQYFAARALQPELAGARARVAQGSSAHKALNEIQEKSFANSKVFQSQLTPKVYEKTQHYINRWLKDANKERERAVYGIKKEQNLMEKNKDLLKKQIQAAESSPMIQVRNKNTGVVKYISQEEANALGAK